MKIRLRDAHSARKCLKRYAPQGGRTVSEQLAFFLHPSLYKNVHRELFGDLLVVRLPLSALVSFRTLLQGYQRTNLSLTVPTFDEYDRASLWTALHLRLEPLWFDAVRVYYDDGLLTFVYDGMDEALLRRILANRFFRRHVPVYRGAGMTDSGALFTPEGVLVRTRRPHVIRAYEIRYLEEFFDRLSVTARRRKLALLMD